jgi:hypothetical protein
MATFRMVMATQQHNPNKSFKVLNGFFPLTNALEICGLLFRFIVCALFSIINVCTLNYWMI